MNTTSGHSLPPNPFMRQPIKTQRRLAGRSSEVATIRYYLSLTAAGQSPHVCMIGRRGIGKTSLLNVTEEVARELRLLPLRLDMTEHVAASSGRFWYDFYSELIQKMVAIGCWGGRGSAIPESLFGAMYCKIPVAPDLAVLQVPTAFARFASSVEAFECPLPILTADVRESIRELAERDHKGLAILIDEADCLGQNVSLLQSLRNLCQAIDRCSLVIAGTEAVFPRLSGVFSPIPRQFYRLDVKPFPGWPETASLVMSPLVEADVAEVGPTFDVVKELHELCGGDPSEVQLYAHHMYRSVEQEHSESMALSPEIYRSVLSEYQAHGSAELETLNAIERLPDSLLFKARWLSRRRLTLDQNCAVEILLRSLIARRPLTLEEKADYRKGLTHGYTTLHAMGITKDSDHLDIVGAPVTTGFWKSYVEAQRGGTWRWQDNDFEGSIWSVIATRLTKPKVGIATGIRIPNNESATVALESLRRGERLRGPIEGLGPMIMSGVARAVNDSKVAVDVVYHVASPAGNESHSIRFFEDKETSVTADLLRGWIHEKAPVFKDNEIEFTFVSANRWSLPTAEETHRLARLGNFEVPSILGPNQMIQAIEKFRSGDIAGTAALFESMLTDFEDPLVRNNLGFCQLLQGDNEAALKTLCHEYSEGREPLLDLNKGLAEFLTGKAETAEASLRRGLGKLGPMKSRAKSDVALYVLLLTDENRGVRSVERLPVSCAIILNLVAMGAVAREEALAMLLENNSASKKEWMPLLGVEP